MVKSIPVIAAVLFLSLACTTGTDGDDGVPHDQTTVLGTLNLFVDVWNSGDMETYKVLLDEDDFTFYFDPWDVAYGYVPEKWGYEEEIQAVTNLFDVVGAENVDVELNLEGVAEPWEGADTYKVFYIPYAVHVHWGEEWGDITYATGNIHSMEFTLTEEGWVISEWRDEGLPGSYECTWGMVKVLY